MQKSQYAQRLRRLLFIYSTLALLVLGISISAATITPLYSRLQAAEENNLLSVAKNRAALVREWLRRGRDLALQITSRTKIREMLQAYNAGRVSRQALVAYTRPKLVDALKLSEEVLGITRLDRTGEVVVSCGLAIPPACWPPPRKRTDLIQVGRPVLIGERFCLVIRAGIQDRRGERVGTDLVLLDTEVLRHLVADTAGLGHSGRVILGFIERGRAYPFFHRMQRPGCLPPPLQGPAAQAMLRGPGLDSRKETIFATAAIPDSDWVLTVGMCARELYAPVTRRLILTLSLAALLTLACLGGLWLLLRPLAGRMLIHTSELEAEIDAKTRELKLELEARHRAEDALQKTLDHLETMVQERTAELERSNQERKELSRRLIDLLEGVRREVAMDLHDQTGQLLTTLKMDLEAVRAGLESPQQEPARRLREALAKVDLVLAGIRDIARGLRPDLLDYVGLVPSLEALFDHCRASAGLKISFFHRNIPRRFHRDQELALYRVAQEAVTNVIRHAQAREVHVNLVRRGDIISLSVEDDGIGFEAQAAVSSSRVEGSLGLTLMRERMVHLGGEFTLESSPGRGTHIVAEVRLHPAESSEEENAPLQGTDRR